MSLPSHWKIRVGALVLALFASLQFAVAQTPPDIKTRKFTLAIVTFEGLSTLTQENALALSGLQIGQTVTLEDLTAAIQQMLNKGQISQGKYSYQYNEDNLEVVFLIKELRGSMPVSFDNFIWFTDDEINQAIQKTLPGYDGKVTEGGEMVMTVQRTLETLLQEKKIKGRVEGEMLGFGSVYQFRAVDLQMPVCSTTFSGAQAFTEKELNEVMKEFLNADFSRQVGRIIAKDRLVPFYRQHGYLKIKVGDIDGRPAEGKQCAKGTVQVTAKLDEGSVYKWNGITFSGNEVVKTEKLTDLFKLKSNNTADGLKIDQAFRLAEQLYGETGYFKASIPAQPIFDETAKTVSYNVTINEGPRFNFGKLAVKGLTLDTSTEVLTKWQSLQGKPYNNKIFSNFMTDAMRITSSRIPPGVNSKVLEESLSVDFVIEFQ